MFGGECSVLFPSTSCNEIHAQYIFFKNKQAKNKNKINHSTPHNSSSLFYLMAIISVTISWSLACLSISGVVMGFA